MLSTEAEGRGGNTLRDLQNSSYPTKAEFNNCFIIHSKYFPVLTNNIISSPGFLGQQFNNLQRAARKKSKIKFCVIVLVSVKLLMFSCKSSSKSEWVESKYFPNVIEPITFATLSIRIRAGSKSFPFWSSKKLQQLSRLLKNPFFDKLLIGEILPDRSHEQLSVKLPRRTIAGYNDIFSTCEPGKQLD